MRRILVHPGFHKTGTTTLQETLRINRDLLDPHIELHLARDIPQMLLAGAAKEFSAARGKETRAIVATEATEFFDDLDRDDPRPILLSNESLSGYGIGYKRVFHYAAAPVVLKELHNAWQSVMGKTAPFEIYFSTRRTGWLASCYWQRLKKDRYRASYAQFMERYQTAADHAAVIDDTRNRLPEVPITHCDVADAGHPVRPVLAQLGLAPLFEALHLPENENTYPGGDARERLHALNCAPIFGPAYWAQKRAIINGDTSKD